MATRPRQIIAGRTLFVTGRAIDRQFRFVPNDETVHTIRYCLGWCLGDYAIELHAFVWMSNHYHLVLTDRKGELPDFMRDLNSLISRALNANRGRRGQNYAREGYNLVVDADREAVLGHCAYTEANPCSAHLVERATQWEGVSSARMEYGEAVTVARPAFGLWAEAEAGHEEMDRGRAGHRGVSDAPDSVTISLVAPPGSGEHPALETRDLVRAQVRHIECAAREARRENQSEVVGMEAVRARHYTDCPRSQEKFFTSEPQASASSIAASRAIALSYASFLSAYRFALEAFRTQRHTIFPHGTWWMRRNLSVRCAGPSP